MAEAALNIGKLRAVLTADSAQWTGGFRTAAQEHEKFSARVKVSNDAVIRGMSEAGKAASASAKMIAGMSAAGRQAAADQERIAKGFLNSGAALMKSTREAAKPVSEMMKLMSQGNANAQASARMLAGMGEAGRQAAEKLNRVNPVLSLMQRGMDAAKSSWGQMIAGFSVANLITGAINRIAGAIADLAASGAKLSGLSQGFNQLTRSIGESGQAMLLTMRAGALGLVKDLDLIQAANKAILLGLPVTAAEIGKLARTATVLGRAMGQDATQSLDDLITALGRSSPMILDNLGLTVKLGEANEEYARKLGKTADALTDAERKTAFYEAAMRAADKKVADLGQTNLTATEQIKRLGTAAANVAIGAAAGVNANETLSGSLGVLADMAETAAKNLDLYIAARTRLAEQGKTFTFGIGQVMQSIEMERLAATAPKPQRPNFTGLPAITPTEEEIARLDSYSSRLSRVRDQLAHLRPEVRANIKAAIDLGVSSEEIEKRYGLISGAIDIFKDQLRSSNREIQEQSRGAEASAEAYRRWKEQMDDVIHDMHRLAVANASDINERAAKQAEKTADAQLDAFNRTTVARRESSDTIADIEDARAEFEIEQAKRTGASWQQIYAMEAHLADARLQRVIDQAELEFNIRTAWIDRTTAFGEAEYQELKRAHDLAIQSMVEKHQQAEQLKRDELRRTHNFWIQTLGMIQGVALRITDSITDNLVDSLFNFDKHEDERKRLQENVDEARKTYEELTTASAKAATRVEAAHQRMLDAQKAFADAKARHAPVEELQKLNGAAVQARMFYENLAKSGTDSAKEIGEAFDKLRDAEEEANEKFKGRWGQFWDGMKQTFTSVLKDMLAFFSRTFIGGLIQSITGSKLGKLLGDSITGGAGVGLGGLVGGGAAASGLFAAGGASAGLASGAAIDATTEGLAAGSGGASGGLVGFLTNPFTIAAAGAAILGLGIWKKGWFRGGEEALKVSPRRDRHLAQFGDPSNKDVGGAGWNLASALVKAGAGEGGGTLFANYQHADTVKKWESAQAAVNAKLATIGMKVQSFRFGGFVRPGVTMPAILHGGPKGEVIAPFDKFREAVEKGGILGPKARGPVVVNVNVKAWDSVDTARWFRTDGIRQIKQAIVLNTGGLGQAVGEAG